MQTFLPYADFTFSMHCLDDKRLGNQVYRECLTLINGGWSNHPAAKMWADYKPALALYAIAGLDELKRRGRHYPHHYDTFRAYLPSTLPLFLHQHILMPPWLGYEPFHASHRSNLLRKDPIHYGQFGWAEPDDLPYVWPLNLLILKE